MRKRTTVKTIAAAALIGLLTVFPSYAGVWRQEGTKWWYQMDDEGHYPSSGWLEINGLWYCFDENGYMRTGWIKGNNNDWYYCDDSSGAMLANAWTPDGYYIGADGKYVDVETENTTSENTSLEDNTLTASVNGQAITFYLENAVSSSDGYESTYISFTGAGEPQYKMYLRIPLKTKEGSYSDDELKKACYFSLSTKYDNSSGKWGDSYRMVHYSSSRSEDIGTYTLAIDHDLSWDNPEVKGSFSAQLEGFSGSTSGQSITVENGRFHYIRRQMHPKVQQWTGSSGSDTSSGWTDPYGSSDSSESSGSHRDLTICLSCHGSGLCKFCGGNKLRTNKRTGTVYECDICHRTGVCQGCLGTGRVR